MFDWKQERWSSVVLEGGEEESERTNSKGKIRRTAEMGESERYRDSVFRK